tara:strand:+ start:754 stop:954 length:201 start_codon:yes stop_codon:yes gene_type:complete
MVKYSLLATALVILLLAACEGKKSLDGHPMDKPPPSAYAPRDTEPVLDESVTDESSVSKEASEGNE